MLIIFASLEMKYSQFSNLIRSDLLIKALFLFSSSNFGAIVVQA